MRLGDVLRREPAGEGRGGRRSRGAGVPWCERSCDRVHVCDSSTRNEPSTRHPLHTHTHTHAHTHTRARARTRNTPNIDTPFYIFPKNKCRVFLC